MLQLDESKKGTRPKPHLEQLELLLVLLLGGRSRPSDLHHRLVHLPMQIRHLIFQEALLHGQQRSLLQRVAGLSCGFKFEI